MPATSSDNVVVRRCTAEQIVPLRHVVLRAGLPIDAARFPGDDAPDAVHFAAERGGEIIGCCTLHQEPYGGEPAWRLRGMAVAEAEQGGGVGRALLAAVDDYVRQHPHSNLLWANARLIAIKFYERLGWKVVSDLFDIPTAGPHHVMIKRL